MKKFLALIAALTLMMTSIAFAEGVPAPHFGGQTETADPGTAEAAAGEEASAGPADSDAEYIVPEGTLIYQYMRKKFETEGFIISDWAFGDTVAAVEADEKSVKIPASKGNKMLDIKYVLLLAPHGSKSFEQPVCSIMDGNGKNYPCTMWMESENNDLYWDSVTHFSAETTRCKKAFLVPIDGLVYKSSNVGDTYYLLDCIAEIPEEIVNSDVPLYVIIHAVDEADYYVRIQ